MAGFNFRNVGFVGLLTMPTPSPGNSQRDQIGHYGGSGTINLPAIAGAVALSCWLRITNLTQQGGGNNIFLVDGSSSGGPRTYYYSDASGSAQGNAYEFRMNGAIVTSGFQQLPLNTFRKVYMEMPGMLPSGTTLFNRFSNNAVYAFYPCDFAAIIVHSRAFTAAEKADASTDFPTDSVLARYNGDQSGGQLLDSSGHGYHATIR